MAVSSDSDFASVIKEAMRKAKENCGHINVLIVGNTGVGKSTLINAVFQGDLASTGQGRPVNQHIEEITKEGIPLSIFDTRGLENKDYPKILAELKTEIGKRGQSPDPKQHIHIAWVCILEDSRRVQQAEEDLIGLLTKLNIPAIAVVTKARADNGFRDEVVKILPDTKDVLRVQAKEEYLDNGSVNPVHGLQELVAKTMLFVPEAQQRAFTAAQKVDINLKKKIARPIVMVAATSAATIGLAPVPFSDAVGIIPIQIGMLAGVSATFGLSVDAVALTTLLGSIFAGAGGPLAGRVLIANLFKMFPVVGTIAGGVISGTTAGALTAMLGEAYIAVIARLFQQNGGELPTFSEIAEAFKKEYWQRAAAA